AAGQGRHRGGGRSGNNKTASKTIHGHGLVNGIRPRFLPHRPHHKKNRPRAQVPGAGQFRTVQRKGDYPRSLRATWGIWFDWARTETPACIRIWARLRFDVSCATSMSWIRLWAADKLT